MKSKMNQEDIKQFVKLELSGWNRSEKYGIIFVLLVISFNAFILKDSPIAIIYAIYGMLYTIIAGKGKISCYIFGLISSLLYSYLSLKNSLYGNLCLNLLYYIPMQILGIFQWKKHLKKTTNEIYKTKLNPKELIILFAAALPISIVGIILLFCLHDSHPIIDGLMTVLSIIAMYLTVKRAIEQWIVWIIVNGLSVIMWLNIALQGEKVYSTIVVWIIYFLLGIYFYFQWKKELTVQ